MSLNDNKICALCEKNTIDNINLGEFCKIGDLDVHH